LIWLFFQAVNYTDLFVPGVRLAPPLKYLVLAGPLYPFFMLYFVALIVYGTFLIFRSLLQSEEVRRTQLMYFLIATMLGYVGGLDNFLIMYDIKLFPLFPYGTYAIAIYVILAAFIIFKYRFLNIEVIIKKTLLFTGIIGATVAVVSTPIIVIQFIVGKAIGVPPFLYLIMGAATSFFVYVPIKRFLTHLTDRYLFQKKLDYRKILKAASESLANINSLNHQMRLIVHFLTMRVRIKGAAVFMPENGAHDFILKSSRPGKTSKYPASIAFDSPVLLYLKSEKEKTYLEYHSVVESMRKYGKTAMYSYDLPRMLEEMKKLSAQLIVPSFYQGELQGVLVLGEKKSEEPYSQEDIEVFQTIAQESAIAFENARKHDELIEKNLKMEHINEELRRTQAEVIQMKEEAAVSALSGGISHEVKNSVYGLTSGADTVEESLKSIARSLTAWYRSNDPVPDQGKRELFENIEEALTSIVQVKQASQHIDDVAHTLSQITKGKHAEMGRISIRMFLKNMVTIGMLRTYGDRVRTQALEKPPEVDAPAQLPSVRGHTELLKAVFINLFKNAIYAMDGISPKKIRIRALVDPNDSGMMRIEFSDNGCGIPPDVLPRIFDYGFSTKGAQGEGKGLFNVKTIIEDQHHGKIEVRSEIGKGTVFIIKIPIWKDSEEE